MDKREVTDEEAKDLANSYNIWQIETSALDATNVEEAFELMSKEILSRVVTNNPAPKPIGLKDSGKKLERKKKSLKLSSNILYEKW